MQHFPVMSGEVMEYLAVRRDSRVADLTAGLGGHSKQIAESLEGGVLVMNDRDGESLELAMENTREYAARIRPTKGPFSTFPARLAAMELGRLNGVLIDLGMSMYQLNAEGRGFSFRVDSELDMRMGRDEEGFTAADIVNTFAEKQLADLIYQWGEESRSRAIARALVRARPIRSTLHLSQVVESVVPRTSNISPATKTFMALRLVVNNEMPELEAILEAMPGLMAPGGRLVILTFMSTEDRIVKQKFQEYQRQGLGRILTKHVVKPTDEEVRANPASRSAKLRALEWAE
jgi:16S rRNA (cytosine1402-N4)-methyltransferase